VTTVLWCSDFDKRSNITRSFSVIDSAPSVQLLTHRSHLITLSFTYVWLSFSIWSLLACPLESRCLHTFVHVNKCIQKREICTFSGLINFHNKALTDAVY